jgi:hypothetical protein
VLRRRRPLLAAAMVGGSASMGPQVGERAATSEASEQAAESDRDAPLEAPQWAQPVQALPAPVQGDRTSQIVEPKGLNDQGVLTDEVVDAAKQKLIDER